MKLEYDFNYTLLHIATEKGSTDIAKLLLEIKGIDVNIKSILYFNIF